MGLRMPQRRSVGGRRPSALANEALSDASPILGLEWGWNGNGERLEGQGFRASEV